MTLPRIGWIGTGVMGRAMCHHLLTAGYAVSVHNRTREKAASLIGEGASWRDTPRQVAELSDVVFTIVGYPHDVEKVILDADTGVLAGCSSDAVIVDMTTSSPRLARRIAEQGSERNVFCLDAPVSGGDIGAREAKLSIMVGGEEATFLRVLPQLKQLGTSVVYQGRCGSGQHTKMVNQTLIASGMVGVCEALLYAHQAGLDLTRVMQSVATGAAGSWSLSNYGPRILRGDFEPGFFVEHFIKDMGLALDEAARMKICLPGLALAHQLYLALAAQGHERSGTHALQLALAQLANVEWPVTKFTS